MQTNDTTVSNSYMSFKGLVDFHYPGKIGVWLICLVAFGDVLILVGICAHMFTMHTHIHNLMKSLSPTVCMRLEENIQFLNIINMFWAIVLHVTKFYICIFYGLTLHLLL